MLGAADFAAAVRALIIDKTGKPQWRPSRLDDVGSGMVERILAPMPGQDLVLPTYAEMQALRD